MGAVTSGGVVHIVPDALYRAHSVPVLSVSSLAEMRRRGIGPRYLQLSPKGQVWYRGSDLIEWLESGLTDPAEAIADGDSSEDTGDDPTDV